MLETIDLASSEPFDLQVHSHIFSANCPKTPFSIVRYITRGACRRL